MFGEMFGDRQRPMVLVLGLGESGLAIARWCARHGCRLRVADTRETPPNLAALTAAGVDFEFVGGAFSPALVDGGIELVALSPGLSPLAEDLAPLVAAARERGIPVWGEREFFAQALAARGAHEIPHPIGFANANLNTRRSGAQGLLDVIAVQEALTGTLAADARAPLAAVARDIDLDYVRGDILALIY